MSWFITGKQEKSNFEYIGFKIKQSKGEAILDQEKYVSGIDGVQIKPGKTKEKIIH